MNRDKIPIITGLVVAMLLTTFCIVMTYMATRSASPAIALLPAGFAIIFGIGSVMIFRETLKDMRHWLENNPTVRLIGFSLKVVVLIFLLWRTIESIVGYWHHSKI